jgi:hypothetical protein
MTEEFLCFFAMVRRNSIARHTLEIVALYAKRLSSSTKPGSLMNKCQLFCAKFVDLGLFVCAA